MYFLPHDVHRLIGSFINDEVDKVMYEATCRDTHYSTDASFRKMLYNHVKTIVPQKHGPECTMRFLADTGSCIAGSAGVKSVARVSACKNDDGINWNIPLTSSKGMLEENTDIDFIVPWHDESPVDHVKQKILKHFQKSFIGEPNLVIMQLDTDHRGFCEYRRLHTNVMAIYTLTCPSAKSMQWTKMQFMLLHKGTTVLDAVRSFDIRGLQIALRLSRASYFTSIRCHLDFVRQCDVSIDGQAINDLCHLQIVVSSCAFEGVSLAEWVRTAHRIVKYARDYSWVISKDELNYLKAGFERHLSNEKHAISRLYYREIWNSTCIINPDIFNDIPIVS